MEKGSCEYVILHLQKLQRDEDEMNKVEWWLRRGQLVRSLRNCLIIHLPVQIKVEHRLKKLTNETVVDNCS